MKKTLILLCLAAAGLCPAQQIGLSLENAMIQPTSAETVGREFPVPKLIMAGLRIPLGSDLWIRLSGGYGYEWREQEDALNGHWENRVTGIPVDVEIQASKPLVVLSGIRVGLGIGCAYYRFDGRNRLRSGNDESEIKRELSGMVQYISFGLDLQMSRRFSAVLQIKKPIFSRLTAEQDGFSRETLLAGPGFDDVSVGMGLFLNLRKKSDRSILEIFHNDRDDD